jgi:hypothetical protein
VKKQFEVKKQFLSLTRIPARLLRPFCVETEGEPAAGDVKSPKDIEACILSHKRGTCCEATIEDRLTRR